MGIIEQTAGVMVSANPCLGGGYTIFFMGRDANVVSFVRPQSEEATNLDVTVWDAPILLKNSRFG
jgi:hypothetical protein